MFDTFTFNGDRMEGKQEQGLQTVTMTKQTKPSSNQDKTRDQEYLRTTSKHHQRPRLTLPCCSFESKRMR